MGARAGLGNRAGGPGLRPLWPCRVRPGLRGGAGRRGHRRVTGVSPGVLRAGLPVPLRRRRKRYFPRHVAGRPRPRGTACRRDTEALWLLLEALGEAGRCTATRGPRQQSRARLVPWPLRPSGQSQWSRRGRLRPERHSASAVVGRAWRPRQGRREPASCRGLGPASRCHRPPHFRPCVHVRKPLGS